MDDALKALHDIHTPPPIHPWWPPAPGIVGLGIVLCCLGLILIFSFRHHKAKKLKKMALLQLTILESAYHSGEKASETAAQISILLKQVALLFYPRKDIAALQGEAWLSFLSTSSKKLDFIEVRHSLLHLPYTNETAANEALSKLFEVARSWIKQRSNRCLN